ncbi:MAG: hypothetical protein H0W65_04240 [Sphingomonas sp.]|uniref:hypothetical protein n=1 Tax=Sphingomonas sp. TaxID=28214 RepID=UPI0017D9BD8C|nr:hypothetical protein [Sphingomonas sp.]MBA3666916.1 hypothetical protein [Sphingomonas sp.]
MGRTIALATLAAGTLDILAATLLTLFYHKAPADMLRGVASGPFPDATQWGTGGACLGLVTHFALMAIMAAVFVLAARNWPALTAAPIKLGVIYGLVTYVVMNLIVVPLRFGGWPPKPLSIATQLFCHIVLVGIPIALIAARGLGAKPAA